MVMMNKHDNKKASKLSLLLSDCDKTSTNASTTIIVIEIHSLIINEINNGDQTLINV